MRRKTSIDESRIYTYGCLQPTAGLDLLRDQLAKAATYYNARVDIEMERRARINEARGRVVPSYAERQVLIDEVEAAIDEGFKALRDRRSGGKQRELAVEETIDSLKKRAKALYAEQRLDRLAADKFDEVADAKTLAGALASELAAKAYQESGLYWGTRGLVDNAIIAASSKPRMRKKFERREGRVGIQIQSRGGEFMTWADLCSGRTQTCQVEMRDDTYGVVKVRAGSDGRSPLFVEAPFKLHRLPPRDSIAKWVWFRVTRQGMRTIYEVQFTFEAPSFAADHAVVGGVGQACGIDVGWRERPDGSLRVAVLLGTDGAAEEFTVPPAIIDSVAFAESLVSVNDRLLNEELPIFEATKHLWTDEQRLLWKMRGQWRSWRRLSRASMDLEREHAKFDGAKLWQDWKRDRLAAGLDLFCGIGELAAVAGAYRLTLDQIDLAHLMLWRHKAKHLYQMSCDVRSKALRRRQDYYRCWARSVVERYERVYVEKLELDDLVRVKDRQPMQCRTARANRVLAAQQSLIRMVVERGGERATKRDAKRTTITCTVCGTVGSATPNLIWECPSCRATADQDMAAAANLLAWAGHTHPVVASAAVETPSPTPLAHEKPREKRGKVEGSSRRSRRRERALKRAG